MKDFLEYNDAEDMNKFYNACIMGDDGEISKLITKVDVNRLRHNLESPLYLAADNNNASTVQILLVNGARPNQLVQKGSTSALHAAAAKGYIDIVQLLLQNEWDPKLPNNTEVTPLHRAAQHGHAAITLELLKYDIDPNSRSCSLQTPLHYAALGQFIVSPASEQNYEKTIKYLLLAGGDLTLPDVLGDTFYSLQQKNQHQIDVEPIIDKVNVRRQLVFSSLQRSLKDKEMENDSPVAVEKKKSGMIP